MATIPTKLDAGEAIAKAFLDALVDALADHEGALFVLSAAVKNPSFELLSGSDPASWDVTLYPAGAAASEESEVVHGFRSWKFVRSSGASNGGGHVTSADLIPCAPGTATLTWWYQSTAAVKSLVQFLFYDEDEAYLSTATLSMVEIATVWRAFEAQATVPGGARFLKVRLIGGYTDVDVAGTCRFDGVALALENNRPVLTALEYQVEEGALVTYQSFVVFVPATATTLAVTVQMREPNSGNLGSTYAALSVGGTTGTEAVSSASAYEDKTLSVTLPAGVKGTVATVEIQGRAELPPLNDPNQDSLRVVSDTAQGYEAKIVLSS